MKGKFKRLRGLFILLLLIVVAANSKFLLSIAKESEESINKDNITATANVVLEKYINYENENEKGLLVQYGVDAGIEYKNNENYVPLSATGILFYAPKINNNFPTSVNIIAKSTLLTNGSNDGKDYKFVYKPENGELGIVTFNNKDEDGKYYEEYKSNAKDRFSLILNYDQNAYNGENVERNLEASGKVIEILNTQEDIRISNNFESKENVKENKSNLVSTKLETTKVYNGYIKSNAINGTDYETTYKENLEINISKENLGSKKLELTQKFINKENAEIETENIVFKSSIMDKEKVLETLGEEGTLKILDSEEKVIAELNKNTEVGENGTFKVEYPNGTKQVILELSNAVKIGNITIQNEKEITPEEKNTELAKIQENYNGEITNIDIQESETKVSVTPSKTTWTNERQNEVEFEVKLHNNSSKYNLFKNPVIAIQLPEETEKVILDNATIMNGNGLSVKNAEYNQENRIIKVELQGEQTKYVSQALENGTTITIPATIILANNLESKEIELKSVYQNENKYTGQTETGIIKNTIELENFNQSLMPTNSIQTMAKRLTATAPTQESVTPTAEGISLTVTPVIGDTTRDTVYEGEFIKYEITATNTTEQDIDNVKIVATLPDGVTYGELVREDHKPYVESYYNFEKELQPIELGTIKAGKTGTTFFEVKVNDLAEGETQKEITTKIQSFVGEKLSDEKDITNSINKAEYKSVLVSNIYKTDEFKYCLKITGNTNTEVPVKIKIPYCLDICSLRRDFGMAQEPIDFGTISNNNEITVNLKPDNYAIYTRVNNNNINKKNNFSTEEIYAYATIDNKYKSNENRIMLEYEAVSVSIDSVNKGGKIKYGEDINYELKITNIGKKNYNKNRLDYVSISVLDYLPKNVEAISMTYNYYDINRDDNNNAVNYENKMKNDVELRKNTTYEDGNLATYVKLDLDIPYQQSVTIQIHTKADIVNKETPIENYFTVTGDNFRWQVDDEIITYNSDIEPKKSETISHIILPFRNNTTQPGTPDVPTEPDTPDIPDTPEQPDNPVQPDTPEQPDNPEPTEVKKYNLNGYVWNDKNEDGEKQNDEQLLSGIQIYLLNTKGEVVKETKTDNNGKYIFTDIEKNQYNVVFKYNTNQYKITEYKANGVSINKNAVSTKQEVAINGEKIIAGVTEQITLNNNIENVNLGLVENKKFDFKVDNYISKVTIKTKNGTTEIPYSKADLAKAEIKAKEIEGAVITVEYKIIVTNNGELPGKVGKVIDYLPEGLNISSESISSWIKNPDGSIINTSLSNQKIEAGKSVELTLVATRSINENSTGTLTNKVEISDLNNELETKEINSQNNVAKSELIISISTGALIYISIATIFLICILLILNIKFNIFQNTKFRSLSIVLILGTIIISFSNIPSNAEITELKKEYKYFALWNSSGGRWRIRDFKDGTNRFSKTQDVWFFDSTKVWEVDDIDGYVNINMYPEDDRSKWDMHYIPHDNKRGADQGGYLTFREDEPDLNYNGNWDNVIDYFGGILDFENSKVNEWSIRADLDDKFFIKGDWGQFCETDGLSRNAKIIDAYAGLCEDPGLVSGSSDEIGYYYDRDYTSDRDAWLPENTNSETGKANNFAYYNGSRVNRTDAQKYVWEPTGDANHDFSDGWESKTETIAPTFDLIDNNSNNIVKLKEKDEYYIFGPFNIQSYRDGVKNNDNEYEYRISGSKTSGDSFITTAMYPDYLIPCYSDGRDIPKKLKGNTDTFYLKILKNDLENDVGNVNYIEIASKITYDYHLKITGGGTRLWHVDGWTFDSWQKVSSGYEDINININKPDIEVPDSIKYTNIQGAITIHKQDELSWTENDGNCYTYDSDGNKVTMDGIKFVVNKYGDGWALDNGDGTISYGDIYDRKKNEYHKPVIFTTNTAGWTDTIVGFDTGCTYMVYEIIDDPVRLDGEYYGIPDKFRDIYKATYGAYELWDCPFSLKALGQGDLTNDTTDDDFNMTQENGSYEFNYDQAINFMYSGEFEEFNLTNKRDYISLQIDKKDQFLGKFEDLPKKLSGIKFKVFQEGKGWIDKVNRNDEHSDTKYVNFENAYELETHADGTTDILRRLEAGGKYIIVETYIPDHLKDYYTLQKGNPTSTGTDIWKVFNNCIVPYSSAVLEAWDNENYKIKLIYENGNDKDKYELLTKCKQIKASDTGNGIYKWAARNPRDYFAMQIYKLNKRNEALNGIKFAVLEEAKGSDFSNRKGKWVATDVYGNYGAPIPTYESMLRFGLFTTGEKTRTYQKDGYTRVIKQIPLIKNKTYSIFEIDASDYDKLYNIGTFTFNGEEKQGEKIKTFTVDDEFISNLWAQPNSKDVNGNFIYNVYVERYTNKQDYGAFQIQKVDKLTRKPLKGMKMKIYCVNPGYGWLKIKKNSDGEYEVVDTHATYDQATELETDANGCTPIVWKVPLWASSDMKLTYKVYETSIPATYIDSSTSTAKYTDYYALNADFMNLCTKESDIDKYDDLAIYSASTQMLNMINGLTGNDFKWQDIAKDLGTLEITEDIDPKDNKKPVITELTGENEQTFIDVSGNVWQDGLTGKNSQTFDGKKDYSVQNIEVRLMKRIKFNNKVYTKVKDTQYTDANGNYIFKKLKIKDLENYYIEFVYDGITYQSVEPSIDSEEGKISMKVPSTGKIRERKVQIPGKDSSKATETATQRNALNNAFKEVTGEGQKINYNGNANFEPKYYNKDGWVTLDNSYAPYLEYKGTTAKLKYNNKERQYDYLLNATIDTFKNGTTTKGVLKYYYDLMAYNGTVIRTDGYESNFNTLLTEIPNMNLGLYAREQPDLKLKKDIYKADISINGKRYVYMYNQKLKSGNTETLPTGVDFDEDYRLPIYEADVFYGDNSKYPSGQNPNVPNSEQLNATITYKIRLQNLSNNLYTQVNKIKEYYSNGYTIDSVKIGDKNIAKIYLTDNEAPREDFFNNDNLLGIRFSNPTGTATVNGETLFENTIDLSNNAKLKPHISVGNSDTKYLYIQFKINNDKLRTYYTDLADKEKQGEAVSNIVSNFKNYAEISSYTTFSKDGSKLYAHVDSNSIPNTLRKQNFSIKQNDEDKAPGLKIVKVDQRTLTGIVFEDTPEIKFGTRQIDIEKAGNTAKVIDAGEERIGNGIYDGNDWSTHMDINGDGVPDKDVGVNGIIVRLKGSDGKYAQFWDETNQKWSQYAYVKSKKAGGVNGIFNMAGFIPGDYKVEFVWGQKAGGKDVKLYKGTVFTNPNATTKNISGYQANIKYKNGYNWLGNEETTRYSDAVDDYKRRLAIDMISLGVTKDAYTGQNALYNEISTYFDGKTGLNTSSYMHSSTVQFEVGVERIGEKDSNGNVSGTDANQSKELMKKTFAGFDFNIKNIDFGLIERAKQAMGVEKHIKSIKITTADGRPVVIASVDVNGITAIAGENYISGGFDLGYLWAQVDKNIQQSMKVEIEYEITVAGRSEMDYDNSKYYLYGTDTTNPIKLKATYLYDYVSGATIDSDYVDNGTQNDKWNSVDAKTSKFILVDKDSDTMVDNGNITVREEAILNLYAADKPGKNIDEYINEVHSKFKQSEKDELKKEYEHWKDIIQQKFGGTFNLVNLRKAKLLDKTIIKCDENNTLLKEPYSADEVRKGTLKASKEIANGDEIQFNNDIEIARIAVDVNQKTGAQADFKASPLYDTAEYVTISPATGENKDYVGWTIVAIGILTTLASGVILVKRFVSKK